MYIYLLHSGTRKLAEIYGNLEKRKVLIVFRGNSKAKVKICETGRRQNGSFSNKIAEINTVMYLKVL